MRFYKGLFLCFLCIFGKDGEIFKRFIIVMYSGAVTLEMG